MVCNISDALTDRIGRVSRAPRGIAVILAKGRDRLRSPGFWQDQRLVLSEL